MLRFNDSKVFFSTFMIVDGYDCPKEQFTCQNGKCIEPYFMCDGNDNCGDESDEIEGCLGTYDSFERKR